MELYNFIDEILACSYRLRGGELLGYSVGQRPIKGFRFGKGSKRISLIAGNHADEPIGPLLLMKLVNYLQAQTDTHPLLKNYSWWIVPHGNPDGEAINKSWYTYKDDVSDLAKYLKHVVRELPGKDVEFGYPIEGQIKSLRPENEAVYNFWKRANVSFDLHVSLHGMKSSYGAWYLIDESWIDRSEDLRELCVKKTHELGYHLYDLDRFGEKGFKRIAEGFCTRPDSKNMRNHFLNLNDHETAKLFHASSMESIRSLSDDCLTLVSEMPLFLIPKKERELVWPDPYLQNWNKQFLKWKTELLSGTISEAELNNQAKELGVTPMSWKDQMKLQWNFICAGLQVV